MNDQEERPSLALYWGGHFKLVVVGGIKAVFDAPGRLYYDPRSQRLQLFDENGQIRLVGFGANTKSKAERFRMCRCTECASRGPTGSRRAASTTSSSRIRPRTARTWTASSSSGTPTRRPASTSTSSSSRSAEVRMFGDS